MNPADTPNENSPRKFGDYPYLVAEIKERIRSAQYKALKKVNKALVGLYRDIGRMIVERRETAGWGKSVVKRLSEDLRQEFPGVSGFSIPKPLVHAPVLFGVPRQRTAPTTGWRNSLGP